MRINTITFILYYILTVKKSKHQDSTDWPVEEVGAPWVVFSIIKTGVNVK